MTQFNILIRVSVLTPRILHRHNRRRASSRRGHLFELEGFPGVFRAVAHFATRRMSHLLVTLRRGTAGKPKTILQTLSALGLRKTRDARIVPNDAGARGKLNQVKHLVSVETLEDAERRVEALAKKRALRTPIVSEH